MATTENLFTGNGSTTNYSFTFEYIKQADVKVTLDAVDTTAFTFANATTLSFTTAPANAVAIRIFRNTDIDTLNATFFPGSAIKAEDLNNNFTQAHFATQETDNEVITANTTANTAKTTADTAKTTADTAKTTADAASTTATTADTNASAAVTTANAAETKADNAVTTADAASDTATDAETEAASAVTTANTASTNASTAVTTANTAETAANSAETKADEAVTTADEAETKADSAIATANTASTNASAAVTTANTADTNATTALNTANAASAAVSNAVLFTLVADESAIPTSPSDNDYIEIGDSTDIESFTPLSGLPSGFVGASGLTVRLRYDDSASSWVFMSYFANDSEDRYLTKNIPVVTGDATNGSGQITLNCENNSHGVKIKGPPHSAAASYTLTLPNDTGSVGQALTTNGSGVLSFSSVDSAFIETPQTITTNKVIAANINAGMMGPTVSISSGISITVGANSLLKVLN